MTGGCPTRAEGREVKKPRKRDRGEGETLNQSGDDEEGFEGALSDLRRRSIDEARCDRSIPSSRQVLEDP